MKLPRFNAFFIACLLVLLIGVPAFSQDTGNTPSSEETISVPTPAVDALPQAKETAIYGEVQTVDASASILSVQYYDYDSDSEKTADIAIDIDTKLENVSAIGDVKKGDWIDVTYIVNNGKNIAKVVTVEKEETPALEEASPQAPASSSVPLE